MSTTQIQQDKNDRIKKYLLGFGSVSIIYSVILLIAMVVFCIIAYKEDSNITRVGNSICATIQLLLSLLLISVGSVMIFEGRKM